MIHSFYRLSHSSPIRRTIEDNSSKVDLVEADSGAFSLMGVDGAVFFLAVGNVDETWLVIRLVLGMPHPRARVHL